MPALELDYDKHLAVGVSSVYIMHPVPMLSFIPFSYEESYTILVIQSSLADRYLANHLKMTF